MKKILILLMLAMSFFVVSCGGDEDGCVNEYEVRIISCAIDDTKQQAQRCVSGEWVNYGMCYLCKDNESRIINCATDKTRDQIQFCFSDNWIDKGVCLCPESNKFCHSHDGLDWSDASSDSMTWDQAVTYCENLGGRLPTISELRTLIQNCPAIETGGECGLTDSCSDCWNYPFCNGCEWDNSGKYNVLGGIDWFWSSSELPANKDKVWYVVFVDGRLNSDRKRNSHHAYCVK